MKQNPTADAASTNKRYLTAADISRKLFGSEDKTRLVTLWLCRRALPFIQVTRRTRLVEAARFEEWLNSRKVEAK